MEKCIRCNVREDEVKLFDAIYNGRMGFICERCAIIENIPVIKKPDTSQLKESEQAVGVMDRMKRLSGIKNTEKDETFFREDELNELDENPELERPEKEKLNLVNHFHWDIMKNRRRKGLTHQQLAETLGESEIAVAMIEKGKLPENADSLINKLEQYFQVKLRKIPEIERIMEEKHQMPILRDEKGKQLKTIPEEELQPEIISSTSEIQASKPIEIDDYNVEEIKQINEPQIPDEDKEIIDEEIEIPDEFNIQKANFDEVTIQDLKEIHRKKIEASKQEMKEEQTRIEERQRVIEARKEELRLRREKESDELDKSLGGTELLNESENQDIPKPDEDKFNPNL